MRREEVNNHVGQLVTLNGYGDLAICGELRQFIFNNMRFLTIVKLTRGGMVYLRGDDGEFYSVRPKNVDLKLPESSADLKNTKPPEPPSPDQISNFFL